MNSPRRRLSAVAVYLGIAGWLLWMVTLTGTPDAGAEKISIVEPGADDVSTAADGFVDWRGAGRCPPREWSAPENTDWTLRTSVRDQPGPQLAWVTLRCSDDSRARFARVAVNSRSFRTHSPKKLKTVAHLRLNVKSMRGELTPVVAAMVERHLKDGVKGKIFYGEDESTSTEVGMKIEEISTSDLVFEVNDGLRFWTRYHFKGTGAEYECDFCFVPNPFSFSGEGVLAVKIRIDRDANSVHIVRDGTGHSTGISLSSFETNIKDLEFPWYCAAVAAVPFIGPVAASFCDVDFDDGGRQTFENGVRNKLQGEFGVYLDELSGSLEKLLAKLRAEQVDPLVGKLKKLVEGSELSTNLYVSNWGEHVDAFIRVRSRWLDQHGIPMAAASEVELLRDERRHALNVKVSYALLNRILASARGGDLARTWEQLSNMVPAVEEIAGGRVRETVHAVAGGIRHFGLRFDDPIDLPIFVFPAGEKDVGIAVHGASLFRATDPYRNEDVSIRLWMEGRVGLGRNTTNDDVRFLRSHIAFEPMASSTVDGERMLEKYRQLSSIFLDIIEGKHNDWTDLLSKERRMQIATLRDAIPEIFEAIDGFQPPYRIALLGGKRPILLRNDPTQYALLVNLRGS